MRVFRIIGLVICLLIIVYALPASAAILNSDRLDQRDPSAQDDTAAGYAVGDIWINHKDHKAWKIADGTKGAARWQALPWPTAKLADAVTSAPCVLGVGTRQLKSSYTGSLIALVRARDGAASSFGFTSEGINSAGIDTFLKNEAGDITKLYDQCGEHNLTALTDHNRAGYAFDKATGQAAVIFNGINHANDQVNSPLFQNAGGPMIGANNFSVFMVGASMGAALDAVILDFDPTKHALLLGSQAGTRTFLKPAPPGGNSFGIAFESVPGVMGLTSGKAVKTYFNNRVQTVPGTYPSVAMNGLNLGGTDAVTAYPGSFDMQALVIFSKELTPPEIENLMLAAAAEFGLVPQARTKLIGIGDSVMAGWGARMSWLRIVQRRLPGTTGFYNFAVPGIRSLDWLKNVAHITSVFAPGMRYIIAIDLGGNDLKDAEGRAPDAVYADVSALLKILREAAAKAGATAKIGLATVLPNSVTKTREDNRKVFNQLVLANKAQFDFVIDFAGNPKLGAAGANENQNLYMDTVHPTSAGQGMMADQAAPIIQAQ